MCVVCDSYPFATEVKIEYVASIRDNLTAKKKNVHKNCFLANIPSWNLAQ